MTKYKVTVIVAFAMTLLAFIMSAVNSYQKYSELPYTVIGIQNVQTFKSTGKYSSEIVNRYYIRIQYESGTQRTMEIDDPWIAQSYQVGQQYIEKNDFLEAVGHGPWHSMIGVAILLILTCISITVGLIGFVCLMAWAFGVNLND
jgi:hypothetical protein